jgi:hypothetical protein
MLQTVRRPGGASCETDAGHGTTQLNALSSPVGVVAQRRSQLVSCTVGWKERPGRDADRSAVPGADTKNQ